MARQFPQINPNAKTDHEHRQNWQKLGQILAEEDGDPGEDPIQTKVKHNLLSKTHTDSTTATAVAGDIIMRTAAGKWARLAKGAANYFLMGGASILAWTRLLYGKGQVLGHDGTDHGALAAGTNGHVLTADSAETLGVKWAAVSGIITDHGGLTGLGDDDHSQYHNDTRGDARYPLKSLVTAKGDILAATASGVLAKLAAGTDAWSLVADSSEPTGLKYANVSAAGVTDHGALTGLGDDDHTIYVKHALATAASDFVVASGAGAFVKKTLAETKTILGLPGVRMKTGNYAGDGTNPHAITGAGFQPTFLIVWEQDGGDGVRFKSDQDTTYTKAAGGGYDGTEILSLDADGFTLHSAATVNQSGKTYTYVAFG